MQWTTPLWAETAGTSHSEDEEVSTSSAPLTKTYGGDGMRLYDQVVLREATEAQTSAWPTGATHRAGLYFKDFLHQRGPLIDQPRKKQNVPCTPSQREWGSRAHSDTRRNARPGIAARPRGKCIFEHKGCVA
jgi:hypothetical protein